MGIMTRFLRLWKADLHGVMDQLEDKSLLLKQCLREMETTLQQKQTHLSQLRRACEQIRGTQAARTKERERVELDIALAVRKEKDDIARMLIRKRITLQADHDRLAVQLRQLEEEEDRLARMFSEQQGQYERLKVKAAVYCQQAEQQGMQDSSAIWTEPAGSSLATEEEIELELMRCKESFAQGGAS
jgi:phage shock protein A